MSEFDKSRSELSRRMREFRGSKLNSCALPCKTMWFMNTEEVVRVPSSELLIQTKSKQQELMSMNTPFWGLSSPCLEATTVKSTGPLRRNAVHELLDMCIFNLSSLFLLSINNLCVLFSFSSLKLTQVVLYSLYSYRHEGMLYQIYY